MDKRHLNNDKKKHETNNKNIKAMAEKY